MTTKHRKCFNKPQKVFHSVGGLWNSSFWIVLTVKFLRHIRDSYLFGAVLIQSPFKITWHIRLLTLYSEGN